MLNTQSKPEIFVVWSNEIEGAFPAGCWSSPAFGMNHAVHTFGGILVIDQQPFISLLKQTAIILENELQSRFIGTD